MRVLLQAQDGDAANWEGPSRHLHTSPSMETTMANYGRGRPGDNEQWLSMPLVPPGCDSDDYMNADDAHDEEAWSPVLNISDSNGAHGVVSPIQGNLIGACKAAAPAWPQKPCRTSTSEETYFTESS